MITTAADIAITIDVFSSRDSSFRAGTLTDLLCRCVCKRSRPLAFETPREPL